MALLLLMAVFLVGNLLLSAFFLWLGARWLKASKPSYSRALMATLVLGVLGVLLLPVTTWLPNLLGRATPRAFLVMEGAVLAGQILLSGLVIRHVIQTTFARAIVVWLVSLIPGMAAIGVVFLVVRPYVLEAFMVAGNSMAPTVVGWHTTGVCPHCQGLLIVPALPPEERQAVAFAGDQLGICTSCLKTGQTQTADSSIQVPDRIMVNKLIQPQRWDLIVVRYPENPSVRYVKRLVGLPGETVFIQEGAIWINEVQVEPPAELTELRYTTELMGGLAVKMGSPENPWRLEQDQYCVLGDFSQNSLDSRSWGPLPGSHIDGVVALRYWPVSRWKLFR